MPTQPTPGLERAACAPHLLVPRAARVIVERERERLPDLTHAVVLVPDLHAAADIAAALREAAAAPALLLPRIATLGQWAAGVPLERPIASRAAREALLYRELEKRGWFASADLWAVSGELGALFDELTRHGVALPSDFAEFNRQLERAYRAQSGESLTFEARLVHELWNVLARAGGEVDPEAAYQLRLARLAEAASAPLYALALSRLAPAERRFLERYAARAPVGILEADLEAGADAVGRTLAAAWPQGAERAGLLERARALAGTLPASALAGRLRLVGAGGAEQEAQAVDATVREWLLAGKRRIAVVVQDRLVARRARALLERAQVLVKDEAGWACSTTSAATAVGRWLDVAGGDCYHRDLLDLLKSPFAFHDWRREARQAAVWRLEGYVREENVIAGLASFIRLAEDRNDAEVRQMLARVRAGVSALGRGSRPIARWLAALAASLDHLGVRDGLAADSAGDQLLELLGRLGQELAADTLRVGFAEWRRWLARQLEAATFRDPAIESPVVFTSLAATRLRRFDAALVLGCDAAHLPGPDPVSLFFNQGVRAELKLPTWPERVREMEEQLAALIASCGSVVVTWQRTLEGEPNPLAPPLERLAALHRLAYGDGLEDRGAAARLAAAEVRAPGPAAPIEPTRRPAPRVPAALLPRRVSASGYNSLLACPYQFHARYLLGLAGLDDVQELIEKKDYGTLVHGVLAAFHRAHPRVSALDPAAAERELEELSERAFAGAVGRNYLAVAWLARWKALIPAYLEWQREREAAGWTWHAAEARRELAIVTPQGNTVTLHGRLDRVDSREPPAASSQLSAASPQPPAVGPQPSDAGDPSSLTPHPSSLEFAVIDYKLRDALKLRKSLEAPGEDVQLPVYTLLWGASVAEALFLSMERDGVQAVEAGPDAQSLAEAARARLGEVYDALAAGAGLPAQGVEQVCEYCEARGLCRKNYWP
jgi:ATP-dependent helicase/nuclease subunit B